MSHPDYKLLQQQIDDLMTKRAELQRQIKPDQHERTLSELHQHIARGQLQDAIEKYEHRNDIHISEYEFKLKREHYTDEEWRQHLREKRQRRNALAKK